MHKSTEQKIAAGLLTGSIVFLLLIFTTNLFHYNYHMNADIASETILGELIWKSGQIIPDTWYPSTEVRIISIPNLAAFFYGFTGNMVLASALACCMMTILIFLSILYFAKSADMEKTDGLLMGAVSACCQLSGKLVSVFRRAGFFEERTERLSKAVCGGHSGYGACNRV